METGAAAAKAKVDPKKGIASYSAPRGSFEVVEVPVMRYLMIDGAGDPNTGDEYRAALETLYPMAYRLKFLSKLAGRDYVVPPLEALWWADDMASFTTARDKSTWHWTAMLMTPDWITDEQVETAREAVSQKAPALDGMRVSTLDEGLCVQTLHLGGYDEEGPVLAEMHDEFIPSHGLRMTGRHHEVYLGDPRRAAPERLRTILRQPVERALTAPRDAKPSD